jgi:chaperonin GroES
MFELGGSASADLLIAHHKDPLREDRLKTFQGGLFMNLQPLGDRLIVEVLDEEELTVSGIVLPDTAREKPQRGRVLAVGPGARDEDGKYIEMDVAEGDEIVFSKYGGTEIKLGTDDVLIMRESDVLAKVVSTGGKRKRKLAGATA